MRPSLIAPSMAIALALAWACGASTRGEQGAGTITLSIVATNDLHGGLLERDGRGGSLRRFVSTALLSPMEAWLGLHAQAKGSHLWGASAPDSASH